MKKSYIINRGKRLMKPVRIQYDRHIRTLTQELSEMIPEVKNDLMDDLGISDLRI